MLEGRGRHHAERLTRLLHQHPGVERVAEVDVAGVAEDHLEGQVAVQVAVEARRLLVRVHAVLQLAHRQVGTCHDHVRLLLGVQLLREPAADRSVVLGRQREGLRGEAAAQLDCRATVMRLHLLHQLRVLARRRADGYGRVILGRGTQHRRTTDIDVLNARLEVVSLRHGVLEGVQVQNDQINLLDSVLLHVLLVLRVSSHGKKTSVDLLP